MATYNITEIKNIRYQPECLDNPFTLGWYCPDGGWKQWTFTVYQVLTDSITAQEPVQVGYSNLQTATADLADTAKDTQPYWIVGADDLSLNDAEYLRSLPQSVATYWLRSPWVSGQPDWFQVRVEAGTFPVLDTLGEPFTIRLNIYMPRINTQRR